MGTLLEFSSRMPHFNKQSIALPLVILSVALAGAVCVRASEVDVHKQLLELAGDEKDARLKEICVQVIPCPQMKNPVFQAILSTVGVQFLAYHIAVKRGTDVDQPRNLAKSVTVE